MPIQDRSSAESCRNHGMSRSIRATAAVVSAPTDDWQPSGHRPRPVAASYRPVDAHDCEPRAPATVIVGRDDETQPGQS